MLILKQKRNKIIKYLRLNICTLSAWAGVYGHLVFWISGGIFSSSSAWLNCQQHQFTQKAAGILPSLQDSDCLNKQKICRKEAKECQCSKENVVCLCASWTPLQHISHHTYYTDWVTCFAWELHARLLNNLVSGIWVWRLNWLSEGSNRCQMARLLPHILAGLTAK